MPDFAVMAVERHRPALLLDGERRFARVFADDKFEEWGSERWGELRAFCWSLKGWG